MTKALAKATQSKPKGKPLTKQQQLFCHEYVKDFNGQQAAIRAGYSKKSAGQTASCILKYPQVAEKIARLMQSRTDRIDYSADKVLERLGLIAFTKNRDILKTDEHGRPILDQHGHAEVDLEKVADLPLGELAFDGKTGALKKIKQPSAIEALTLLGRHHKLFTDKVEHDLSDELVARLNRGRSRLGAPIEVKPEEAA